MLAGPAPEVLIGPIASATERIRVGSGGVMLPHYSPLKVAESFSLLSGLFPGPHRPRDRPRAGHRPGTTHVLQRDRRQAPPDDFFDQLAELLAYLEDRFPDDHPLERLTALPGPARGARAVAARLLAAERDLGRRPRPALRVRRLHQLRRRRRDRALYRERFADSERLPTPRAAVAVWAIAADTDEEAQRLAYASRMAMAMLRRGRLIAVPPVEKAERFLKGEGLLDRAGRPPARARHAGRRSARSSSRSPPTTTPTR